MVLKLVQDPDAHAAMSQELARWHSPHAAQQIAERMLVLMKAIGPGGMGSSDPSEHRSQSGLHSKQAAVL
jgi:hypothetical protein